MKVFVPFSERVVEETGLGIGQLVPFKLEYACARLAGWASVEVLDAPRKSPADLDLQAS